VDFDDGKKEGRRRRGGTGSDRDRSLPPLLARVNGQIEVYHHAACSFSEASETVAVHLVL